MPGKYLYEYAVIRFVPKVEREEFINVGIILFSKQANYLKTCLSINKEKLKLFPSEIDLESLTTNLMAFEEICSGKKNGGIIASMDLADRFRWLTATRSSSIQTSNARTGFSHNLDITMKKLLSEQVL